MKAFFTPDPKIFTIQIQPSPQIQASLSHRGSCSVHQGDVVQHARSEVRVSTTEVQRAGG